jgi:hypothetical protein
MNRTMLRVALAATVAVVPLTMSAPAEAGTLSCTTSNIDIPNLNANIGGAVNCIMDNAGFCIFFYDPLFNFPNNVAPATVWVVNCLV